MTARKKCVREIIGHCAREKGREREGERKRGRERFYRPSFF
jgi:hypothetical protein